MLLCIQNVTQCEPRGKLQYIIISFLTTKLSAVNKAISNARSIKYKRQTNQHQEFKTKTTHCSTVQLSLNFLDNRELNCANEANMCFTYVHHQQIYHLVLTGFRLRPKLSIRRLNCFCFFQSSICAFNVQLISCVYHFLL